MYHIKSYLSSIKCDNRNEARFSALHEARGPGSAAKEPSTTIKNIGRFEWEPGLGTAIDRIAPKPDLAA